MISVGKRLHAAIHGPVDNLRLDTYTGNQETCIRWNYVCRYLPQISANKLFSSCFMLYMMSRQRPTINNEIMILFSRHLVTEDDIVDYALLEVGYDNIGFLWILSMTNAVKIYNIFDKRTIVEYMEDMMSSNKVCYKILAIIVASGDKDTFDTIIRSYTNSYRNVLKSFFAGVAYRQESIEWLYDLILDTQYDPKVYFKEFVRNASLNRNLIDHSYVVYNIILTDYPSFVPKNYRYTVYYEIVFRLGLYSYDQIKDFPTTPELQEWLRNFDDV